MSDECLREKERLWKETGAVEAEAAYLLERLRAGELSRDGLDLAAYLGHSASLHALGEQMAEPLVAVEDFYDGLSRWEGAQVRALIVFAARNVARFESEYLADREDLQQIIEDIGENIEYAEDFLIFGSDSSRFLLCQTAQPLYNMVQEYFCEEGVFPQLDGGQQLLLNVFMCLYRFIDCFELLEGIDLAEEREAPPFILDPAVVSSELIPWALGTCDPVRERVEGRIRAGQQVEVREEIVGVVENEGADE